MKEEKELLVAVASQKGGVGKSVFTVLLASVLHYRKGLRVAVVDCDSRAILCCGESQSTTATRSPLR